MSEMVQCPACEGDQGHHENHGKPDEKWIDCPYCEGDGVVSKLDVEADEDADRSEGRLTVSEGQESNIMGGDTGVDADDPYLFIVEDEDGL